MLKNNWVKWRKTKRVLCTFNILFYQLFKLFRLKKKYIVFQSFLNNNWGTYEEAVFEEVYKRYNKTHEIIWISGVIPEKHGDKNIVFINPWSIKAPKVIAKAKYFISGTYTKMPFLSKKTKVFYLNHGYSVKTMGLDWVNEAKGLKRIIRKLAANNQNKQIDICFAHDEYDALAYKRVFNHNGKKETKFLSNGFPHLNKYEKGEALLFLPSWHEKSEVVFPNVKMKNKFVSPHPRTKNINVPDGWTVVTPEERRQLKIKYVISDNSAAPVEYIKSGIQVYWMDGKYDRDICQDFRKEYKDLVINLENFKPLSEVKYKKVVKQILDAPYGEESTKITVDKMNIE
ncbi:CDP-glycerol glycerophosphotransferase family protein [Mycoplasma todarodis]|uniref:Glycosyltransferase n=1 Tax=Mycoplasma todarodis TaxID=1937191 RepID=A0A4R0XQG8_9MOLU|nr:CDP-glycerol glycerophosphotransferase family protein [Mycoplasma todarodis]TCG11826.1 hypothetical protein C4B25_00715 [Mycoplasma todarodis]